MIAARFMVIPGAPAPVAPFSHAVPKQRGPVFQSGPRLTDRVTRLLGRRNA